MTGPRAYHRISTSVDACSADLTVPDLAATYEACVEARCKITEHPA